jgi:CRISPR-associated endonuclease/helicase Cas3
MKTFYSHKDKPLEVHTDGVTKKTQNRTHLKIAEIAAIFHDLGKINPNFQRKLNSEKNLGYSSHAYLSALAWLCFFENNKAQAREILDRKLPLLYSVATIIARHHGNLPNLESGFFNKEECERLEKFIQESSIEDLPISEFLQPLLKHEKFHVKLETEFLKRLLYVFPQEFETKILDRITDRLDFFLDTHFSFASLIESDKRDASLNEIIKRGEKSDFQQKFSIGLAEFLEKLSEKSAKETDEKKIKLDELRSAMREESLTNLRSSLARGERIFTLPAPTGAGKTLMLLSLANEVLKHDEKLSVIYALPFLAITEQTENVCKSIFENDSEYVLRVDSKSENKEIEAIQNELDGNPSDENLSRLMREIFAAETFDHRFIITTFVQIFETLVSNRNAKLLRLPNFSKTIFLLDEIQALPPNLYTFFVAYLDEFCRKFDSYAIVSTATMPNLAMPDNDKLPDNKKYPPEKEPLKLFTRYQKPSELLGEKFYSSPEFNRYRITPKKIETIERLAEEIENRQESVLVVLNTIGDTKKLYEILGDNENEYVLLNTHFTLEDRQRKLKLCREKLSSKERIVLISTQLIEAGVDVDFPVVYRDLCPLPNLIQTAGRCNRNGRLEIGEVFLFELKSENGKSSASKVYGRNFAWFLNETKNAVTQTIYEKEILALQNNFAEKVNENLTCGLIESSNINLVECVNKARFEDFAKLKLIDDELFGFDFRYYVPKNSTDRKFEELQDIFDEKIQPRDFAKLRIQRNRIKSQLQKMSPRIVNLRLFTQDLAPAQNGEEICGIRELANPDDYSEITGIGLSANAGFII